MLTIDQIIAHMEHMIAQGQLEGRRDSLRQLQYAAGILMRAAESNGDAASAKRFQLVATQAANKQDELRGE
jgi:hypothetical protein